MFFLIVDLVRSERYGFNSTESNLCSVFNFLLTRRPTNIGGEEYYLADYEYVANLCHLLPQKRDSLQRLYKKLENIGLIRTLKVGNHLYFTPSQDLRDWGNQFDNIQNGSTEKNPNSTDFKPENTENFPNGTEQNGAHYPHEVFCPAPVRTRPVLSPLSGRGKRARGTARRLSDV